MDARTRTRSGGFSLLEILIAIMIVGIIAAAVVPMIGDYASKARLARIHTNVQEIDKAMARYDLLHRAPLGYVYDPSQNPPAYVEYRPEDAVGIWRQLMNPTDSNGNVLNDAVTAQSGPFDLGPYLRGEEGAASLLLAVGEEPAQRWSGVVDLTLEPNPDGSADLTMTFTPCIDPLGGQKPLTVTTHFESDDPSPEQTLNATFAKLKKVETVRFWTDRPVLGASVFIRGASSALAGERPVAPVYSVAPVLPELSGASLILGTHHSSPSRPSPRARLGLVLWRVCERVRDQLPGTAFRLICMGSILEKLPE